jgi:hypothetical protein
MYPLIALLALALSAGAASGQIPSGDRALQPTPVIVQEDGQGSKSVAGWRQPAQTRPNWKDVWENGRESRIWLEEIPQRDMDRILADFARNNGLTDLEVRGLRVLEKVRLLDSDGHGWTVLASASRGTERFRLALLMVYGSLDDTPPTTGVHAYMAPEEDFIRTGGWVVPASFWLGVDPQRDVGELVDQGLKEDAVQVEVFGALSDLWMESIYNAFILQMQADLRALHNLRMSAIAAGDPNAIIVPGENGYNRIEYRH